MKFESKFGIGEIVNIAANVHNRYSRGKDYLGEVVGVYIHKTTFTYLVDAQYPTGIQRQLFEDWQLEGDPDFDQDKGEYPAETND